MKKLSMTAGLLLAFPLILCPLTAQVIPSPGISALVTSDLYTVEANGVPLWTERFVADMDTGRLPDWFSDPWVRKPQEVHLASFAAEGTIKVAIKVLKDFKKVIIRPLSRKIEVSLTKEGFAFTCNRPEKLYIEIDSLPPLFIFADPPETDIPSADGHGIHFFGPGIHRTGFIHLKSNETLYIAPGAVVYGGIRADSANGIRVMGRGVLDGNFEFRQMVRLRHCTDVLVEGITIRFGNGWTNTLINCDGVKYNHVKVLSFGPGGDGINPVGSRNVQITDCFLRCTDDCIAIKAPAPDHVVKNIVIADNTMLGFAYSDGVTIGYETNGPSVNQVMVRNCDILMARGGSRVEGHSGFSIICDGPAVISDILFENIRVEKSEFKLFELQVTDGTKYGKGPPGSINNITLKDVEWLHDGLLVIKGFDDNHRVSGVKFENCRVSGRPLSEVKTNLLEVNEFTDDIIINNKP
jgi:hypothetical protein